MHGAAEHAATLCVVIKPISSQFEQPVAEISLRL